MKINSISSLNFSSLAFKSNKINYLEKLIARDSFEPSDVYKYVKIKDMDDNEVYASIIRRAKKDKTGQDVVDFLIKRGDENLGYAKTVNYDTFNGLFLDELYTSENRFRKYKGCGTELIKCAVEESKRMGKNGKVVCCAFHSGESPIIFYFKNNFTPCHNHNFPGVIKPEFFNAPLEYVAKNNKKIYEVLPSYFDLTYMELDKQGAEALLNGRKLHEERICDEVGKTDIGCQTYSAQYVYFPDKNKHFLQILDESAYNHQLALVLELEPNEKSFKISSAKTSFNSYSKDVYNFAQSLLDDLATKYL